MVHLRDHELRLSQTFRDHGEDGGFERIGADVPAVAAVVSRPGEGATTAVVPIAALLGLSHHRAPALRARDVPRESVHVLAASLSASLRVVQPFLDPREHIRRDDGGRRIGNLDPVSLRSHCHLATRPSVALRCSDRASVDRAPGVGFVPQHVHERCRRPLLPGEGRNGLVVQAVGDRDG